MIFVDPKRTSKECHVCGNLEDMKLSDRTFRCSKCGLILDRDINAAINIQNRGMKELTITPGTGGGACLSSPNTGSSPAVSFSRTAEADEVGPLGGSGSQINLTEDRLEISADTKQEEEKKEKGYVYKERRSGSYYRSISLPSPIDPDDAKASYNNGVLEIKMTKTEIKKKTPLKIE